MTKRSREEPPASELLDSVLESQTSLPAMQSPPASSPRGKLAHLDSNQNGDHDVMRCSLPPHRETISFSSYEEYEVHYAQEHVNRCLECGKNFPTARFLSLHIEELHDPLIAARRERGEKTFACFVEDCDRKCSTGQKRRMHLIDKHMFPRQYNFSIVNAGIDQYDSMLRGGAAPTHWRRVSIPNSTQHENRLRRRKFSRSMDVENRDNNEALSNISSSSTVNVNVNGSYNTPPGTIQLPMHVKSELGFKSTPSPVKTEAAPSTGLPKTNGSGKSDDIADLEKSMSALRFVPKSVTLRRMDMEKQRGRNGR
ncbi:hypothetical protein AJ79_08409 [Helicocarpus griseus UAMH5409]|uniref:C2H2-type domain-containing protein n=1 Tax=Helicocarpus griseus UAMH5409 TaxID=1447875 RepID=A0A2B7WTK8_9EURO|nr:hypothetical protein AJ79_08409 [Helicocarpus griseus UAMH5409]